MVEDDDLDEGLENPELTRWSILVNLQEGRWVVARVSKNYQVGECEIDMSRTGSDWLVAAFFDQNVESLLKAMNEIAGNSVEGGSRIEDLLSGVCRSFAEAQANLERWQAAHGDPDPAQDL
jgi:hypothetical protein